MIFSWIPATTPTTITTPEIPQVCTDARTLNYNSHPYSQFDARGNDLNGELTESADSALLGSGEEYNNVSSTGEITILIKLTDICVQAEVVLYRFTLRGADVYQIRAGIHIAAYVSFLGCQLLSPFICLSMGDSVYHRQILNAYKTRWCKLESHLLSEQSSYKPNSTTHFCDFGWWR